MFEHEAELESAAKEQVANVVSKRSLEFTSPHFSGCLAAQMVGYGVPNPSSHAHRSILNDVPWTAPPEVGADVTFEEMAELANDYLSDIDDNLERVARETDEMLFDYVGVPDTQQEMILQEVGLRTIDDPLGDRRDKDAESESTDESPVTLDGLAKDFLLQLSMDILSADNDGVVPISNVDDEESLLTRIESRFEQIFGEHASARLAEIDQILGSRAADEEAYPNLREWLEEDLFDYHVSTFDRTPTMWRLTTERLVSDPEGEGFACLIDYHQLDEGVFDRLQNRYLEPRKALLRERRSAANRRRGDASLSASEKAAAAEEYTRCESGLEQIGVLEDRLAKLAQPSDLEWPEETQQTARNAAQLVAKFRKETAARLDALEELAGLEDVDMEDMFSPTFYETVQGNQEEWLDALDDLETAFEAYSTEMNKPVEAGVYDLFEYYDDLVGSTHYASNGILFMTYYFSKFETSENRKISDEDLSKRERLLSRLAQGLDEYESLANEIADACDEVKSELPTDWEDRALDEISMAGYRPNRKHGVEINIRPLADAKVVPKTVEDDVL
ncbi:hypothetical protein [Halogeometricum sp. CBA1124]|uniref:hypothetical protein n=1 Tax=Halogeometricum sp. CBA1124 TaxID=2668071 RepID=UPI001E409D7D|nr:hypothetical protein [Halogeometricum sp. CBA1124]